ncbi:MAG: hypothetical protein R2698_11735 [Microthrixaceae bacterium]
MADDVIALIADAAGRTPRKAEPTSAHQLNPALRPAVTLVTAWVAQQARSLRIDPAILATRGDLEAFMAGDDTSRLSGGWRHQLIGEPLRRLVDGEVAMAFVPGRGLVMEERSHREVTLHP